MTTSFDVHADEAFTIELHDATSRTVLREPLRNEAGTARLDLSIAHLAPGAYALSLLSSAGTRIDQVRVVKE